MKKLMIALAAGVLAVGANAASVDWTATKGYLYDGAGDSAAKVTSGTAYLVLTSYAQSDLVTAFATSGAATTLAGLQSNAAYLGSGDIGSNARIAAGTGTSSATSAATAYFVVFNDDKMYISDTATSDYDALGQSHSFVFSSMTTASKATLDMTAGYSTAGWYGAVPEPTSGLLMLLGMAGLALRRRRA